MIRSASDRSSSSENLPPRTIARVAREVRDLLQSPPEGTKLIVDPDTGLPSNLGELKAEVEGPTGTPYTSRFFNLKLVLPVDFPHSPPRGFFLTKIYHPNVDMTSGAICVNTLKKDWSPNVTISHVLSVIRCLLIVPFPESSLNDEAGKLFMESYEEYARRATLMTSVHGRPHSYDENHVSSPCSPVKNTKENDNGNEFQTLEKSLKPAGASSSSTVLKQSNSVKDNGTDIGRKLKSTRKSKSAVEKKGKKKSLKRL